MHKKVCIITSGRINKSDTTNNGLLLRSLFNTWPKEKISQIYNSGSNNDEGFGGAYYKLGENDRRFGWLYSILYKENKALNPRNHSNTSFKKKILWEDSLMFSNVLLSKLEFMNLYFIHGYQEN